MYRLTRELRVRAVRCKNRNTLRVSAVPLIAALGLGLGRAVLGFIHYVIDISSNRDTIHRSPHAAPCAASPRGARGASAVRDSKGCRMRCRMRAQGSRFPGLVLAQHTRHKEHTENTRCLNTAPREPRRVKLQTLLVPRQTATVQCTRSTCGNSEHTPDEVGVAQRPNKLCRALQCAGLAVLAIERTQLCVPSTTPRRGWL